MQRYLISTKSSIPYFEPSRPIPDSFTPPNGATSFDPPNGHRFYRAMPVQWRTLRMSPGPSGRRDERLIGRWHLALDAEGSPHLLVGVLDTGAETLAPGLRYRRIAGRRTIFRSGGQWPRLSNRPAHEPEPSGAFSPVLPHPARLGKARGYAAGPRAPGAAAGGAGRTVARQASAATNRSSTIHSSTIHSS